MSNAFRRALLFGHRSFETNPGKQQAVIVPFFTGSARQFAAQALAPMEFSFTFFSCEFISLRARARIVDTFVDQFFPDADTRKRTKMLWRKCELFVNVCAVLVHSVSDIHLRSSAPYTN